MTVKRVALVSNMHEQCGNAAYGRDLVRELQKHFESVFMGHETEVPYPVDVVIFNWHPARVELSPEKILHVKEMGAKTIVIYQNSHEERLEIEPGHALSLADAVVTHEPMNSAIDFHVIPHGIVEVDRLPEVSADMFFGTAGFPFDWKRYDVVAEAARRYNVRCLMIAPKSDQSDTDAFMDGIAGHLGGLADIRRNWMTVDEVVRELAMATLNIFWYQSRCPDDMLGQSGSVRMGIAAKRPTIISTHRKLRTLQRYSDELYIAETEEDVYNHIDTILSDLDNAKRPLNLMKDQGWSHTGAMYAELINTVVDGSR